MNEVNDEDDKLFSFPFYRKQEYEPVFHFPNNDWKIEAVWDDGYYRAAKRLIEGVAFGNYLPALEGVVGLYLFRHYLELGLKFIIFHSRWLKDAKNNSQFDEIDEVKKTHSLRQLWDIAKKECKRIIPSQEWTLIDITFIDNCISEIDGIDPNGERFRYHGPTFGVEKDPIKREELAKTHYSHVSINWAKLAEIIEHSYEVLSYLDSYMIETHGMNEEWESYLRSI